MSSKIKVDTIENVAGSGNVSLGSGHNLVVPGDLTVDTSLLKVDSTNNRIGIGTASPTQATLHVAGGGVPARFESTSSATTYVQFGASGTSNYGQIAMNGNDMTLRTAYTDRMKIDGSGRILQLTQPAFSARGTDANWRAVPGTGSTWAGIGGTTYSNTSGNYQQGTNFSTSGHYGAENVGSCFADATAVFTAPVTGHYFFYIRFYLNRTNTNSPGIYLNPRINNTSTDGSSGGIQGSYVFERTTQGLNANNAYIPFGRQDVYKMSANDTFTYALNPEAAGFQMYGAYTEFKGYLIG